MIINIIFALTIDELAKFNNNRPCAGMKIP
jgi:hypothetical protein